jgi:hypothetical protein
VSLLTNLDIGHSKPFRSIGHPLIHSPASISEDRPAPPARRAGSRPAPRSRRAALAGAARAGNRRFWLLSALCAHTKVPYKPDLLWETLRALNCPGRARTVSRAPPSTLLLTTGWSPAGRFRIPAGAGAGAAASSAAAVAAVPPASGGGPGHGTGLQRAVSWPASAGGGGGGAVGPTL